MLVYGGFQGALGGLYTGLVYAACCRRSVKGIGALQLKGCMVVLSDVGVSPSVCIRGFKV